MESTHPENQKAETGKQSPWAQRSPVEFTPHQGGSKTLQRSLWAGVALLGVIVLQLFLASGSRPPDRWEYMDRTVIIPLIPSALTVAGQAGWEVISVSELTGFDKIDRRLWFKRRLHSGNAALDRAADPWPVSFRLKTLSNQPWGRMEGALRLAGSPPKRRPSARSPTSPCARPDCSSRYSRCCRRPRGPARNRSIPAPGS
jgi:hypothetical protein